MNGLRQLWENRRKADLKETLPYLGYVFSSGFGLVLAATVILTIQGYIMLLRQTNETGEFPLPFPLVGAAAVAPFLLWNPVRTYLKDADIVFLTPAESKIKLYFGSAWKNGFLLSAVGAGAVILALWPFYSALGGTPLHFVIILVIVAAMKAVLFFGAWLERQFVSRMLRAVFLAVKALAVFASVYQLLRPPHMLSIAAVIAIWAAYLLSLRAPEKFSLRWEGLIREERRSKLLIERWYSQFVDLPRSEEAYRLRPYLEPFLRLALKGKRNAYLYLYWRTLLRSSMFGIVMRLVGVAYFFMFLFPGKWITPVVYGLFLFLIGIQLNALHSVRRDLLHLAVSPVPEEQRLAAIRTVRRTMHRVCNLLMVLPLFLIVSWRVYLVLAAVGIVAPVLFARGRRRKI